MKMTTRDVFVDVATLSRPACESQRADTIGTGSISYRRKTVPAARHGERLWGRLRTGAGRGRIFVSLIYPRFGNRAIELLKRIDIVRLLAISQRSTAQPSPGRARHPVEALQSARQPER
jgi:hypothetical protein